VVYSTCSLNPLEDEAVVASVIGDVGGVSAMEIVPLPEWLVEKCRVLEGLQEWHVPNPTFGKKDVDEMYQWFDDVPVEHQGGVGEKRKKKGGQINRSMFPPEKDSDLSRQLGHCGRLLPSAGLDSGGFFVACIRRLQVGELGAKGQASHDASNASKEIGSEEKETVSTTPIAKNSQDELIEAEEPNLSATNIPTTDDQCLREGDWICTSCKKVNFGRRGGSRCFVCKARKPHSAAEKDKEDKNNKIQLPLLVPPKESVLESFFEFFGIATGPESPFPLQNTRVMCRRKAKENMIVVVSDALSKLAISESWSPV